MGWAIKPEIIALAQKGLGRIDIDVKAWRVHIMLAGPASVLVDGVELAVPAAAPAAAAAASIGAIIDGGVILAGGMDFRLTLGGLFDAYARPILVVHTFQLQTANDTPMQGWFVIEHLVQGEWPVP